MPRRSDVPPIATHAFGRLFPDRVVVIRGGGLGWRVYRGVKMICDTTSHADAISYAQRLARHIATERIAAAEGQP